MTNLTRKKYFILKATPIYVTGKVTGSINNQQLEDLDFYSYVLTHTSDSRNFVAIGKIPVNLGGSFQVLISIVNPINWLFAGRNGNGQNSNDKVPNGFMKSGKQQKYLKYATKFKKIKKSFYRRSLYKTIDVDIFRRK